MRGWTTVELQMLEENSHLSARELAEMFGRTIVAINSIRYKHKIFSHSAHAKKNKKQINIEQMVTWRKQGIKVKEIAKRVGLSKDIAGKKIREAIREGRC